MDVWMVLAIIAFGIALVLVEIFLIPGTTVVGVMGAICMITGVILGYTLDNATHGNLILLGTSIATVILGYLSYKFLFSSPYTLKQELDGKVNVIEEGEINVGDTGEAVSVLRPAGTARINGRKYEVHTQGDFISVGTPIKVVRISSSKIFVEESA